MAVTIKFKRGAFASLPVLGDGEPGFCSDSKQMFIGQGGTNYEIVTSGSTVLDARYYTETELGDNASNATAGAKLIGTFDEYANATASNVQDVLKAFDTAISNATSSGENNTASNQGAAGVGVFKQKTGIDLEFKNINTADTHVTVTDDGTNNEIDISTDATDANTASTIVARDASGNFSASMVTSDVTGDLTGNADTATTLATSRSFSITGDGTAPVVAFNGSGNVELSLTVDKVDGKDVDDNETSTDYLWTAGKIIDYLESKENSLDWQDSVVDKDAVTPPGSPATGSRYIVGGNEAAVTSVTAGSKTIVTTADISSSIATGDTIKYRDGLGYTVQLTVASVSGTSIVVNEVVLTKTGGTLYHSDAAWSPLGPDEIAQWDGSSWTNISAGSGAPNEGWAVWVEDEDKNYVFNGDQWVTFGSTSTHGGLSGLQGGTTDEYYHLTNTQHVTLTGWVGTQGAATVLAAPTGGAGSASFRNLVAGDLPTATSSALGVASFSDENFTVSAGAVTILADGIDNTHIDFGTGAGQVNTDVLTEGSTNLYYTDARAQSAISVANSDSVSLTYSGGQISADVNVDNTTIKIDASNDYIYVDAVDGGSW